MSDMWGYQTLPDEKVQHVVGNVAVACGVVVRGGKGDFRVISVEGMVETMKLEDISKEKSTLSEGIMKMTCLVEDMCI